MNFLTILFTCTSLLVAGLVGITLSVPMQAPALVVMGVAGLFAAIKLWQMETGEQLARPGRHPYIWLQGLALVAIIFFTARALSSPVWDLGVEDLMLILPAGALYLIAGYALKGKAGIALRQGLAWIVILLLLLHIGACLMQLKGGDGYSLARYFTNAVRASPEYVTGMYGYYGSFANFAVIAGLLCLSLGIWGRFTYGLRALIFLFGLGGLGLAVWSQSRSAALSLCLALGVFILLLFISLAKRSATNKKRVRMVSSSLGLMGLIAVAIGGLWVFSQRGVKSLAMIFDSGIRVPLWAMAAEQWGDHPWVGAGSRSFSYECFRYWGHSLSTGERNPEFVHNEYLQLLTDYGLIGLLLIVGLLLAHLFIGWRQVSKLADAVGEGGFQRGSNAMALTIAGTCGMTAMAVHICFDFRTHLLANLLLLVCCAIWVLPLPRLGVESGAKPAGTGGDQNFQRRVLALLLFALGVGALGLGGQQLWAGLPLLENKMAKEDGAWKPQDVDRKVWISVLEESLARAPQWRRYQRLGALYRLEAVDTKSPEKNEQLLEMAEKAYMASIERHAYNPISRINLAAIYKEQKRWEESDAVYLFASDRSKAREGHFGMHTQWAELHRAIALSKCQEGKNDEARFHFARAKELFEQSKEYGIGRKFSWGQKYARCMIEYADFLDEESSYEAAERLYLLAKKAPHWQKTRLNFHHAYHYYQHGQALWHQRKPEAAYRMMLRAEKCMNEDKRYVTDQNQQTWQDQMEQIQKVIRFFKLTGVGQ